MKNNYFNSFKPIEKEVNSEIYLDYQASTPLDAESI